MDQRPHQDSPPPDPANQNPGINYPNNNAFNQPQHLPNYPLQYNPYQPYQYNNYPKKRSNITIIIVAVVVGVLILCLGAYFGLKLLLGNRSDKRTENNQPKDQITNTSGNTASESKTPKEEQALQSGNPTAERNKSQEETDKNPENSSGLKEQKPRYVEDPAIYLPEPFMKYTFEFHYPDGESGTVDIVTGVIPGFSIITEVELIEQSEAFTQHYVEGPEGIYVFSDEEFNKRSSLWLPFNAKPGDIYHDEGGDFKILELGATCDLGYKKLDNCLVMEVDHLDVGIIYDCYISPGLGTVLIIDKANGAVVMKLISEAAIPEREANDIINRYSPNAMGRPD